jgi:hypothetical protein
MRRSGLPVGIVWLILLSGLTACGGGDDSSKGVALPSDDTTSLPTAKLPRTESVEHFIRRWAAAEERMLNSGRTAAYLALSESCAECRALAQTVHGFYAAGGYVHTDGWRIDSVKGPPSAEDVGLYAVHVHTAPESIKEASARAVEHIPGRSVTYLLGVRRTSGSYGVTSRTSG